MKSKIIIALLLANMLVFAVGCGEKAEEGYEDFLVDENDADTYPTAIAQLGTVEKTATIKLNYSSSESVQLGFTVDNKLIEKVEVKNGDYVEKGQLLVSLDLEDVEEAIEEKEYLLNKTKLNLKQQEEMRDLLLKQAYEYYEGYTQKSDDDKKAYLDKKQEIEDRYSRTIVDLEDAISVGEDSLKLLKNEVLAGRLYAPITGRITSMSGSLEKTYTQKDSAIITISNIDANYFITDDLTYADYFEDGKEYVLMYHADGADKECIVTKTRINDWEDGLYFKPDTEEEFPNDLSAKITILLESRENVLTVPTKAVHTSDSGPFVYVSEDGFLRMQYVEVGLVGDNLTEITKGLDSGVTVAMN